MHGLIIIITAVVAFTSAACGDDNGNGNMMGSSRMLQEVRVTRANPAETIFIGQMVQFSATKVFTDGSTEAVTNTATWGSNNESVATVSPSGLVTAIAAGRAGIFAVADHRGTHDIRVFPNFGGSWTGNEVAVGCQDEGMFDGICGISEFPQPGQVFLHDSRFTQTAASVDAVIDGGDGTAATTTGTITDVGQLDLLSAPYLPADPEINIQLENWRSRADVPSQMTGQYDLLATAPGVSGFVRATVRLENVVKTTATALARPGTGGSAGTRMRDVATRYLERRR